MTDPTPTTFAPTFGQRLRLLATGHPIHALAAAVPVLSYYGGATVTRAHDATGALYTVCCAKNLALNAFGLYVLKDGAATQIAPLVSGRGSIWISMLDGTASWVGWDGSSPPRGAAIPGFAPFTFSGAVGPPGPPGPPGAVGPPGSGAITLFDAPLIAPAWNGRQLAAGAGEWVDIPAVFGAPSASAYLLRLAAHAPAPNVRVRVGTQAAPYFLTLNTQVANVEIHTQGWAHGPAVWVSTVNGAATVWLQALGTG